MQLERKILAILCTLAMIAGACWGLFFAEATQLHTVRVVGSTRSTEVQVKHLAGLSQGEPLVLLDLDAAVEGVQQHPWIKKAQARRVFPDTVVIQVEERRVKALLQLDNLYLVDQDGQPFRLAAPPDLDHPVLSGIPKELASTEPELARRILLDGLSWLEAVEGRGGIYEKQISELRFDTKSGYTLALRNGGEIFLGFADHQILKRLDQLVTTGLDFSKPYRVDLGFDRLAVVTPL